MLDSEKFAIAAHLHVLLRRVNGRVTDVEWMVRSPEYAREIIRVARGEEHADLRRLADKLEAALQPAPRAAAPEPGRVAAFAHSAPAELASGPPSGFLPSTFGAAAPDARTARKRYVGSLR